MLSLGIGSVGFNRNALLLVHNLCWFFLQFLWGSGYVTMPGVCLYLLPEMIKSDFEPGACFVGKL